MVLTFETSQSLPQSIWNFVVSVKMLMVASNRIIHFSVTWKAVAYYLTQHRSRGRFPRLGSGPQSCLLRPNTFPFHSSVTSPTPCACFCRIQNSVHGPKKRDSFFYISLSPPLGIKYYWEGMACVISQCNRCEIYFSTEWKYFIWLFVFF